MIVSNTVGSLPSDSDVAVRSASDGFDPCKCIFALVRLQKDQGMGIFIYPAFSICGRISALRRSKLHSLSIENTLDHMLRITLAPSVRITVSTQQSRRRYLCL